jgi:hypothetical protein
MMTATTPLLPLPLLSVFPIQCFSLMRFQVDHAH